jgi:hypothetical protein
MDFGGRKEGEEFLAGGEHQHWDEAWQREILFHQRQRLVTHRHGQWTHQGILHLCAYDYSQERHIVWNGMLTFACCMVEGWANGHNQKHVEMKNQEIHEEDVS